MRISLCTHIEQYIHIYTLWKTNFYKRINYTDSVFSMAENLKREIYLQVSFKKLSNTTLKFHWIRWNSGRNLINLEKQLCKSLCTLMRSRGKKSHLGKLAWLWYKNLAKSTRCKNYMLCLNTSKAKL